MKIKKLVSLLLGTMLLITPLSACSCLGGSSGDSSSSVPDESSSSGVEETVSDTVSRTQGIRFNKALGNITDYEVVISGFPTETEKYAASVLIDYVKKITGKEIFYGIDGAFANKKVISIGNTKFLEGSATEIDKTELGNDGFVIKTNGDAILICGGGDKGTLYGVYDLLEYQLGVKWLTTTETYIPDNPQAQVYETDRTEIPAFEHRIYLDLPAFSNESAELMTTRRFSSEYLTTVTDSMGGNFKMYQGVTATHNSMDWLNYGNYIKNGTIKKEYIHAFANDGTRPVTSNLTVVQGYAADICWTDGINEDGSYTLEHIAEDGTVTPTAIALAIESMKNHIRNDKSESNYYMFGQMDIPSRGCLCPNCLKDFEKYGDSGIVIRFINALASAVEEFCKEENIEREINMVTFAYSFSSAAPVVESTDGTYTIKDETCSPRDDVVIRLAPIDMNFMLPYDHEGQNNRVLGADFMKKWSFVHDKFFVWDYTTYYSAWFYYHPTISVWPSKLKTLRDMGVEYAMLQSNYLEKAIYQTLMESYVTAKLLWNPDYDMNEIVDEWHRYYFGEAAAPYTQRVEHLLTMTAKDALANNGNNWKVFYATKGVLKTVFNTIDEARAAINDSDATAAEKESYLKHLDLFELQPRYMYLYHYMEFENDKVQMNVVAKEFIQDVLAVGGKYYAEGRLFDLENLIYRI